MINKEYIPYEKSVSVTEHKASTDESIKILNEFQEKAKENLCCSVRIDQAYLNGVAFFFREDHMSNGFELYFKFGLNGTEFKIKTFISDDEWDKERLKNLYEPATGIALNLIAEKASEEIAKELIFASIPKLNKHLKYK